MDFTEDELAVFKFSVIAPLVNGSYPGPATRYFEEAAVKLYSVPGAGEQNFSPSTLKSWLAAYRKHGLAGLSRKKRCDSGKRRNLSDEARASLRDMKQRFPHKPTTLIYSELVNGGLLGDDPASLSTVQRFINALEVPKEEPTVERRRFVMGRANECWQLDELLGPPIVVEGRKRETHLIAALDDASRLVLHAEFFFAANTQALAAVLKSAFLKRGLPDKVFFDNGKIFSSLHTRASLARLGVVASFARPYSPASKGKIERFFRTLRDHLVANLPIEEIHSLDDLNDRLHRYVFDVYNLRPHSGLDGQTPLERFMKDARDLRPCPNPEQLDIAFLRETPRKVSRDAVIQIEKVKFEVPQTLIGRTIRVRYNPQALTTALVFEDKHAANPVTVHRLSAIDNARIPRAQHQPLPISYRDLYLGVDKDV